MNKYKYKKQQERNNNSKPENNIKNTTAWINRVEWLNKILRRARLRTSTVKDWKITREQYRKLWNAKTEILNLNLICMQAITYILYIKGSQLDRPKPENKRLIYEPKRRNIKQNFSPTWVMDSTSLKVDSASRPDSASPFVHSASAGVRNGQIWDFFHNYLMETYLNHNRST